MKQQSAPFAVARQSDESKGLFPHSYPSRERAGRLGEGRSEAYQKLILISALCLCAGISAHATVTLVSVQSPGLSASVVVRGPVRSTPPSTLRPRLRAICT